MLTLKDLELIRAIADTGSLTGAGRQLHVTQSALSQRLSGLHLRTGVPLVERLDGRMRLTQPGERVEASARRVIRELSEVTRELKALAGQRQSQLRITTQCYTCYRWLPFVIADLRKQLPYLSVDVVPEATDAPYAALQNQQVDVAVISNPDPSSSLPERPLFDDELFAVMHESHPLAQRAWIPADAFSGETLVLYTGAKHAIVEEILKPAGVHDFNLIQVRITEAIIELARSGQGIAVIAGWALDDIGAEGLTAVRISRQGFRRTWRAVIGEETEDEHMHNFVRSVRRVGAVIQGQSWREKLRAAKN